MYPDICSTGEIGNYSIYLFIHNWLAILLHFNNNVIIDPERSIYYKRNIPLILGLQDDSESNIQRNYVRTE